MHDSDQRIERFLTFSDSALLSELLGGGDATLKLLRSTLKVDASCRGNVIALRGAEERVHMAESALKTIYHKIKHRIPLTDGDIQAIIHAAKQPESAQMDWASQQPTQPKNKKSQPRRDESQSERSDQSGGHLIRDLAEKVVKTHKRPVSPHSHRQHTYMNLLFEKDVVFASGPAGTGKTYLAVAAAASLFQNGDYEKIILCRPAVEAGESLGFLPGDMKEKVDPYMRPLYDALFDMMPEEKVKRHMEGGKIEIAPLAFMRGRTLKNAFIILDEAQNATKTQMKMFLTRLGEGSRMVVTGDLSQTDLPNPKDSGFDDALKRLKDIDGIGIVEFDGVDIVRHPLTSKIIKAYETTQAT